MLVLFFFFPSLVIPRLSFIKECTKNQQAIVGIVPVSMETNLARGQAVGILEGEKKKTTGNDLTKTLSSPIAPIFQLQGMSNAWTRSVFFKKKKKSSVSCLDFYGRHIVGFQQQTAVSVCVTYGLHFPNERASMCMCSTEFTSKALCD